MPEPVTTGALVATAIASGAATLAKGVLGEVAKDTYAKLKAHVSGWAGGSVADIEARPQSTARQEILAEKIDERPPQEQADLRALAELLIEALAHQGAGPRVATQINVTATHGGMAAGRDQYIGVRPAKPR